MTERKQQFGEAKHITIDSWANIYEVTSMFDRYARPTTDPALASTCVVRINNGFIEQDCDDVPIYTVH
jgi:hypothetical protein